MKESTYERIKNTILFLYYKFRPIRVIPKIHLKDDQYYRGYSTHFKIARWDDEHEFFIGLQGDRYKKIVHVHDRLRDEDVFVPVKELKQMNVFLREEAFDKYIETETF